MSNGSTRRPAGLPAWWVVCCATLLLAGCAGGGPQTATATAQSPPRAEADRPAVELSGTAWRLVAIEEVEGEVDTSGAPVPAVVTFDGDGVEVYDGVNTASGEYEVVDDELAIELGTASDFELPGDRLPQYELIDLLPSARKFEVSGDVLVVEMDSGARLRFELAVGVTPG